MKQKSPKSQKNNPEPMDSTAPSMSNTLFSPIPHPGQATILNNTTRFRVVACGRRFGKTMLAKLEAIQIACEGGRVWWVLPTYTMSYDLWNDLTSQLSALDGITILKTERTIHFEGGGSITVRSGHEPDRLRGSGLDCLIIDEAAYCSEEVWHALRPALTERRGRALLLSTPRGRNWFWSLYQKGVDPLEPDWVSWRMPTEANPLIPKTEIFAAKADMPERHFREEYLAEFMDDAGLVFRGVQACIRQPAAAPQDPICFGVDWGRMNDFTAIIVMGMESRQVYELLRFNQIKWSQQRARLSNLAKRWKPKMILAEENSIGSPNIEALREEGLPIQPYTTLAASKASLIDSLVLAIETGKVGLLDDPVLIGELLSYEMQRMAGGQFRYSAPPNGHDDTVIALALALYAANNLPRARVSLYA